MAKLTRKELGIIERTKREGAEAKNATKELLKSILVFTLIFLFFALMAFTVFKIGR